MADGGLPFELVTFGPSPHVDALLSQRPDDLRSLHADGVPKGFPKAHYRTLPSLSITQDRAGQGMVRFGSTVMDGSMALDPESGEVFELIGRTALRLFVNANLRAFTATVHQVSEAFPFYPDGATREQINSAVDATSKLIQEIDDQAIRPHDAYWSSFLDDMSMGDWATGAVLDLVSGGY